MHSLSNIDFVTDADSEAKGITLQCTYDVSSRQSKWKEFAQWVTFFSI